jgi:hypothetical protein
MLLVIILQIVCIIFLTGIMLYKYIKGGESSKEYWNTYGLFHVITLIVVCIGLMRNVPLYLLHH